MVMTYKIRENILYKNKTLTRQENVSLRRKMARKQKNRDT